MIKNTIKFQKIIIIIVLCSGFYCISFSQSKTKSLSQALLDIDVTFKMPDGYSVEKDGFKDFECWDNKIWNPPKYTIIKNDGSVRIGFNFGEFKDINKTMFKAILSGWNPKKIHIYNSKADADTVNDKIIYYSKQKSKQKYNANHVVLYSKYCQVPYLEKYTNNKIILATTTKRYRVLYLTYIFTEEARKTAIQEINQTEKMIRFKN